MKSLFINLSELYSIRFKGGQNVWVTSNRSFRNRIGGTWSLPSKFKANCTGSRRLPQLCVHCQGSAIHLREAALHLVRSSRERSPLNRLRQSARLCVPLASPPLRSILLKSLRNRVYSLEKFSASRKTISLWCLPSGLPVTLTSPGDAPRERNVTDKDIWLLIWLL